MSPKNLCLVFLLLLVAACNRNPLEVVVSRCPAIAVVGDLGTWTEFKAGSSTKTQDDLAFTASIADLSANCRQNNDVLAAVDFSILAREHDGFQGGSVTLPYFVAIMKDNHTLISKRNYSATLSFDSNGLAKVRDQIVVNIPTIEQARTYSYEILIGFDMDPKDVYFNIVR